MTFLGKISVGACLILISSACGDNELLKFDNISDIRNWTPNVEAPIAKANYTVWQLINQYDEDSTLVVKDNQITIRHFQKNIYSVDVDQVISLPSDIAAFSVEGHIPALGNVPAEGVEIQIPTNPVQINFTTGSIKRMEASAKCRFTLPQTSFRYNVIVKFNNIIGADGQPVEIRAEGGDQTVTEAIGLDEVVFDMSQSANRLLWEVVVAMPGGEMVAGDDLEFNFHLTDFRFTRVEGKIAAQNLDIPEGSFNMGIDFWEKFSGNFNFADPKLELIVDNYGLAVPVQLDMDFVAYGDGKTAAFEAYDGYKPTFNGWLPDGGRVVETQGYNKNNSNIAELLSLPPKEKIVYSGKVLVNPDPTNDVTILNNGSIKVDGYVEIPLYLSATDLIFNDTVGDIDISDADKIMSAELIIRAENGIPLKLAAGSLLLLDKNYNSIDTVPVTNNLIEAPEVNAAGDVVSPAKSVCPIELTKKNILHLDRTKYIVISVKAETSNEGKIPVRLKADAALKLNLNLKAQADINDL